MPNKSRHWEILNIDFSHYSFLDALKYLFLKVNTFTLQFEDTSQLLIPGAAQSLYIITSSFCSTKLIVFRLKMK
jgi:hypothetical protein